MLPDGASAELAHPAIRDQLMEQHLTARTVVSLQRGACACDLLALGGSSKDQERDLRTRYRALGITRSATISALELHRRPKSRLPYPPVWPDLVAGFVAEHARNAGPALYLLQFVAGPHAAIRRPKKPSRTTAAEVRAASGDWLVLDQPVVVDP